MQSALDEHGKQGTGTIPVSFSPCVDLIIGGCLSACYVWCVAELLQSVIRQTCSRAGQRSGVVLICLSGDAVCCVVDMESCQ